ncbi:MAG: PLP-dependent transferase [Bacteroidetes bacterium]|nr:MAG: PLP-dependent transferase [Bacteroidota bacterium]
MELSYILNSLGEDHEQYFNAVAPPIVQTSNFTFGTVEALRAAFADEYGHFLYSRGQNPTVEILRKKLAALDGAEDALVFNSGASAIFCGVLSQVKAGDHIVSVSSPYTWAQRLFNVILPRFGVSTTYIDGGQIENWERACQTNTTLFYLESPNSWTFGIQPLAQVAALAKGRGICTLIDNSYCTPLYQQPLALGIDMALQSATKYIGGHSDCVAGVLAGSRIKMEAIFNSELMASGSGCTPFHAWLLLRGLRTLPMRLQHISNTTRVVLAFLKNHPLVEKVWFPLDPNFEQYELASSQMTGACGLLTVVLKLHSAKQLTAFAENLKAFKMAVSWGGHESLVIPRVAALPEMSFDANDPLQRSMRLYLGLESPEYLMADVENALRKAKST